MPEFQLDYGTATAASTFKALDSFTQGYIECAFFAAGDEGVSDASLADLASQSLAKMIEDCKDFQQSFAELLDSAYEFEHYDAAYAGHDFWLTRNGHGAGFGIAG